MRFSKLVSLVAVVTVFTVASIAMVPSLIPTRAPSWTPTSVVGTIKPETLRCEAQRCTVTIRAERMEALDGDLSRREAEVDVTFDSSVVLGDPERATPWPDAKSALIAAGNGRVRLRGELDFLNGRSVLLARRGARMSAAVNPVSRARGELFSECGRPPWSQATLERCFTAAQHRYPGMVRATLATEALAETLPPERVTALDLEVISMSDDGFAIVPPVSYEIARLTPDAKLDLGPADRSALSTLRVGVQLELDGEYELPAPASGKAADGPRCEVDSCWPRLTVSWIRVAPKY